MSDDEKKIRHLEMIEKIITRMADNSFLLKRWGILVLVAIVALSHWENSEYVILAAIIPCIMLWILDSYHLCIERRYRSHYDVVRAKSNDEIDYSMHCEYDKDDREMRYLNAFRSRTESVFYILIIVSIVVIFFVCKV